MQVIIIINIYIIYLYIYIYIYIYIGQFLWEKMHGYGVYEWEDGEKYEGTRFG